MKYNPYNQIWVITWRAGTVLQYIFYGIHGPVFIIFLKIKILKCVLTGYSTIAPFVIFHVPTNSNSSIGNFETYKKSSKSCGPKMPYGWKLTFIIILVRIPSIFEGVALLWSCYIFSLLQHSLIFARSKFKVIVKNRTPAVAVASLRLTMHSASKHRNGAALPLRSQKPKLDWYLDFDSIIY